MVPDFDDRKALFIFDGICVLCSGGASWIMRHDSKALVNFTPAQEALGRALLLERPMALESMTPKRHLPLRRQLRESLLKGR